MTQASTPTISSRQKRVLFVVHAYHNRGGVEAHTKALEAGLGPEFQVGVVFPHQGGICFKTGVQETLLPADPPQWPVTPYEAPRTAASLAQVLAMFSPHVVHVQHFLHWHLGLLDQLALTGVPVLLSFHEYYAITPFFTMEHATNPLETFTVEYSRKVFGKDITPYLLQRKEVLHRSFAKVALKITPSEYLANTLQQVYPGTYRVMPHGIEPFEPLPRIARSNEELRFGYLGTLIPQKGWPSLCHAFALVRQRHPKVELHLHGGGTAPEGTADGMYFHGVYDAQDLPAILSQIDVGVIPSVFRETFSYVLSELWQGRTPVAAADIGALGERVRTEGGGKLFVPGSIESIAETLSWFVEQSAWRTWALPTPRTLEAMLADYRELYADYH
ncbi:MAG: glycosyltransferase [Bdellovibrionales bacterium]|nr:glycosyltransferase [Bdellovibrionales bacterium]